MAKTVDSITKALKLKAQPKSGVLSVRLGTKKISLPFEARMLSGDNFMFIHIPPTAAILKVGDKGAHPVTEIGDATAAQSAFRTPVKRATRAAKPAVVELPADVRDALRKIPAGYRLDYSGGEPKLVKMRKRRK